MHTSINEVCEHRARNSFGPNSHGNVRGFVMGMCGLFLLPNSGDAIVYVAFLDYFLVDRVGMMHVYYFTQKGENSKIVQKFALLTVGLTQRMYNGKNTVQPPPKHENHKKERASCFDDFALPTLVEKRCLYIGISQLALLPFRCSWYCYPLQCADSGLNILVWYISIRCEPHIFW